MTSPVTAAIPEPEPPPGDAPRQASERPPSGEAVRDALVAQGRIAAPPTRFDHVDERRLRNPSQMLRARGLLPRFMSWLAFRKVAFDERNVATIRDQARDGDVVYVMNRHSLLDYLYFNYAFLRFSLPLVYFANRISLTAFKPLWRILAYWARRLVRYYRHRLSPTERLALGLERGHPTLLFLQQRTIWPWAPDKHDPTFLRAVIAAQLERTAACEGTDLRPRPIRLVPQLLVWTPSTDRARKSFWTAVFGNPEAPGRLRKLINFLINRRRAFVQTGKPIDLTVFLRGREDEDLDALASALRIEIHHALSLEERVIKGPVLKRAKQLREELLDSDRLQAAIARIAELSGQPPRAIRKELRGYLKEMSADFSITYVEIMCILMTLILSRLYSEIVVDRPGLERVREAARHAPLVLLPCHRSHVDYLVLSYIFYANGLIPPHIAAGKNLNFFPLGHIFRRCGAFFLRRSFKGNDRYTLAFREYIRQLVREGYWIEFFIEGGRSRTGKMLPPKFGMLKIIVDAVRGRAAEDVKLVPIYVGYEHVIEERSFTRELRGGEKKKENITALFNATQVLWARYGRLYVNFAEPISCREALVTFDGEGLPPGEDDTEASRRFLASLGYRISRGINSVAVVTPSALAAAALLFHDKRGVERDVLLARVGFLLELASLRKAPLSKTLEHALRIRRQEIAEAREAAGDTPLLATGERSPLARARGAAVADAVGEVLARWVKEKHLESHVFDDEEIVYALRDERRINLDFYKNNLVHLLVAEAIMATAVRSTLVGAQTTLARLTEAAAFLVRTLRHEFVIDPERGFAARFNEVLLRFEAGGLIRRTPGEDFADVKVTVTEHGGPTLALFHRVLLPWLEAYWILAMAIEKLGAAPVSEAALLREAQTLGQRRYHVGDILYPEAASSVNFGHALEAFEEFGFLTRTRKGRDRLVEAAPGDAEGGDGVTRFAELADRLREYIALPLM